MKHVQPRSNPFTLIPKHSHRKEPHEGAGSFLPYPDIPASLQIAARACLYKHSKLQNYG